MSNNKITSLNDVTRIALGIDRGFGGTKYTSDFADGNIESLVAPISEERAKEIMANNSGNENVIILNYENKYYLIGSYVAEIEPNYSERDLRRNREGNNETILFLAGMGLATNNIQKSEIVVTTGLPTDDFEGMRLEYEKKILNDKKPYEFTLYCGDKKFAKNLTVVRANIENQPKGTIMTVINNKLNSDEDWFSIAQKKFGVLDLGFNTSDASTYVGKDIVKGDKVNFSTFAMVEIVATAKRYIDSSFRTKKSEDEILKALETGQVKIRGEYKDCNEQIEKAFTEKAILLVNELASKWESIIDTFDELILTGGCVENETFAKLLINLIKEHTGWGVIIPDNPRMANAFGFYLISTSILQNM